MQFYYVRKIQKHAARRIRIALDTRRDDVYLTIYLVYITTYWEFSLAFSWQL